MTHEAARWGIITELQGDEQQDETWVQTAKKGRRSNGIEQRAKDEIAETENI
jgi:hypothetical protein